MDKKRIGKRIIDSEFLENLVKNNRVIELEKIINDYLVTIEHPFFSQNGDFLSYYLQNYDISYDMVKFILKFFKYKNLNYGYTFCRFSILDHADEINKSPLAIAIERNCFKVADYLISYGADINYIRYHTLKLIANKKNSIYLLLKGINITPELINILIENLPIEIIKHVEKEIEENNIKKNSNYFLRQIFRYNIFNNKLIIKLLTFTKNKKSLSHQELQNIIYNENNRIPIEEKMYENAIHYNNWDALNILYENDRREKDVIFNEIYNVLKILTPDKIEEILKNIKNEEIINSVKERFLHSNTLFELIKLNELSKLKTYISDNTIHLNYLNNKYNYKKDILKFSIENSDSTSLINYIIKECQYNNLNYNFYDNENGQYVTFIYFALAKNKFNISDLLLKNGADINKNDLLTQLYDNKLLNNKNLLYILNNNIHIDQNLYNKSSNEIDNSKFLVKLLINNEIEFLKIIIKNYGLNNNNIIDLLSISRDENIISNHPAATDFQNKIKKIIFNKTLYQIAINNENFELVNILYCNDDREKEIIKFEFFDLLANENNNSNQQQLLEEKKTKFINQVKSGELRIPILDEQFINNLELKEEYKHQILEKIKINDISGLNDYLITNNLSLHYFNTKDFDLLIHSIENDAFFDMIKYIIGHYKNLNYFIRKYTTPLLSAFNKNDSKIVELLIENGADINYCIKSNKIYSVFETMIHEGCFNKEILLFLLDHGLKITTEIMVNLINKNMKGVVKVILKRNPNLAIEHEWYERSSRYSSNILDVFFNHNDCGNSLFLNNDNPSVVDELFKGALKNNSSEALKILINHELFDFNTVSLEEILENETEKGIINLSECIDSVIRQKTLNFKNINFEKITSSLINKFISDIEIWYSIHFNSSVDDTHSNDIEEIEEKDLLETSKIQYERYFKALDIIIENFISHETIDLASINFENLLLDLGKFPPRIISKLDLFSSCSEFIKSLIRKCIENNTFIFFKGRFENLLEYINKNEYLNNDFDFIDLVIRKSFHHNTLDYRNLDIKRIFASLKCMANVQMVKVFMIELLNCKYFNLKNIDIKKLILGSVELEDQSIIEYIMESVTNHRTFNFNKMMDIKTMLFISGKIDQDHFFKYFVRKTLKHRTVKFNDINETIEKILLIVSQINNPIKAKFILDEAFKYNKFTYHESFDLRAIDFNKILILANRHGNTYVMKYIMDEFLGPKAFKFINMERILLSASKLENKDAMKLMITKLFNLTSLDNIHENNTFVLSKCKAMNAQYLSLVLNVLIKLNKLPLIRYILKNQNINYHINIDINDRNDEYPIIVASDSIKNYGEGEEIFEYLRKYKESIGSDKNKNKISNELLLIKAIEDGNYIVIQKMIKTIDKKELENQIVNDMASYIKDQDLRQIELIKGIIHGDEEDKDRLKNFSINNCSHLLVFYLLDHPKIARRLIHELNVNVLDQYGYSFLHYAIIKEDIELIKYLISIPSSQLLFRRNGNLRGHSLMDLALYVKNSDITAILLEQNNQLIHEFNEKGESPALTLFKMKNYTDDEKVNFMTNLIQKGSNINCCNRRGQSLLAYLLEHHEFKPSTTLIECLIHHGLMISPVDMEKIVDQDRMDIIKVLVSESKSRDNNDKLLKDDQEVYSYDQICSTLLTHSLQKKDTLAKYIIDHCGSSINSRDIYGNYPLIVASECQNENMIRYLVEAGAEVNIKNRYGETALLIASEYNNGEMMKYLIHHESDINSVDQWGNVPLKVTFRASNLDMVKYLIHSGADLYKENTYNEFFLCLKELNCDNNPKVLNYLMNHGLDINKEDRNGDTPLIFSLKIGDEFLTKYFISNGADVNRKNSGGKTPLILSIEYNYTSSINLIKYLVSAGADVNEEDDHGHTPLISGTQRNNLTIMKYLIHCGADVNQESREGETALRIAIKNGHIDLVKYLIGNGAEVNQHCPLDDSSPLSLATKYKYEDDMTIIEYLIGSGAHLTPLNSPVKNSILEKVVKLVENGVDLHKANESGDSPLSVAFNYNNKPAMKYLIDHGADINQETKDGESFLIHSIKNSYMDLLKFLIRNGADVNGEDSHGDIPLILSTKYKNKYLIEYLLTFGADINKENQQGDNPLFVAIEANNIEMIKYLVENGADVNKVNRKGNTPLKAAIEVGSLPIIKYLIGNGADVNQKTKPGLTISSVVSSSTNPTDTTKNTMATTTTTHDTNATNTEPTFDSTAFSKATRHKIENMSIVKYLIGSGANISENRNGDSDEDDNDKENISHHRNKRGSQNSKNSGELSSGKSYTQAHNVLDRIKHLIASGVDINKVNESGDSSLSVAVEYNNKTLLSYLLKHGGDINQENKYGETFLVSTIKNSYLDMARYLIKKGADIHKEDKNGDTPLIAATKLRNKSFIRYLLERGAEIDRENQFGWTPLTLAIESMSFDLTKFLVECGADVNKESGNGMTPLKMAIKINSLRMVKYLIGNGAEVTKKSSVDGAEDDGANPLLSCAIQHIPRNINIIEYLIGSGAPVSHLNLSTEFNVIEKLKHLIDSGANVNKISKTGDTPLSIAVHYNNKSMIQYLLENGADINMETRHGETYLIQTVKNGYLDMAHYLIESGAKINQEDRRGRTALTAAIQMGDISGVKHLMRWGASINEENSQGRLPIMVAIDEDQVEMIEYFIRSGAELKKPTRNNETVISYVQKTSKNPKIIELFK